MNWQLGSKALNALHGLALHTQLYMPLVLLVYIQPDNVASDAGFCTTG